MRIGVGLPATIPDTAGAVITEWARRAEAGPFSSLAVLDRVVYDNYDPLVALAAAAAVTRRLSLVTTIVIAPLRSPARLAGQALSLNRLSDGRLTLGVGLGAREDDYRAAGVPYRSRGRRLTETLREVRDRWDVAPNTGCQPCARPRLLVGGSGGLGLTRMARFSDGFVHNGGPPRAFARASTEARAAWEDAGRAHVPQLWGMGYFALGSETAGKAYLTHYYAFTGAFAERIATGILTTPEEVFAFIRGYEEAGCTDLVLFPTVANVDQLDRLADLLAVGPAS